MDFQFATLNQIKKQQIANDYDTLIDRFYEEHKGLELIDTQQFINTLTQSITQSFDTPDQRYKYIVTLTSAQCESNSFSTTTTPPQVDFTMATLWNNNKDDVYTKALSSVNIENKIYIINIFSISKTD